MALGACLLLVAKSSNEKEVIASTVYSLGLLLLFGTSAVYHRHSWEPKKRTLLKRLDHSAIFILVAGTFTPICLLALPEEEGSRLLLITWAFALVGIAQTIFWVNAPKWYIALSYVVMGWLVIPYCQDLKLTLGSRDLTLLIAGGVAYTVGAVLYAVKRPILSPKIFGYHELFHTLTIIGATLHFIVIYRLIV